MVEDCLPGSVALFYKGILFSYLILCKVRHLGVQPSFIDGEDLESHRVLEIMR